MKVIKIELKNNNYYVLETDTKSFIEDENVLYFSLNYLKLNKENVKKVLASHEVERVVYLDFESFLVMGELMSVKKIKFDIDKSLTRKVLDKLIILDINRVECYFMPSDYVHELSKKKVVINFNNDMKFDKDFILNNNFKNLKSIYYRKKISFYTEEEVKKNLRGFLKVNNSLKLIDLYVYSKDIIEYIIIELDTYKFKNVSIFIHQNASNALEIRKDVEYLRKLNKKYSNEDREIRFIYEEEYFNNRIFKELTINGLKICMIFLMYAALFITISSKYHEYINYLNLRKLEKDIELTPSIDEVDDTSTTIYINKYQNIPTTYDKLLTINKDVVGWLKVNNTKINYPVTQTNNNEYYLSHDIYGNQVRTGWVFMDYRNGIKELDKNTIIYGHNLKSGYMFGELLNTTSSSWYKNQDNLVITFNSLDKEMKWKVFSIYRVDNTSEYLKTSFSLDEEFLEFVSDIKSKSINDFNVEVTSTDKILTLSTCSGINRRLVVHAVLMS